MSRGRPAICRKSSGYDGSSRWRGTTSSASAIRLVEADGGERLKVASRRDLGTPPEPANRGAVETKQAAKQDQGYAIENSSGRSESKLGPAEVVTPRLLITSRWYDGKKEGTMRVFVAGATGAIGSPLVAAPNRT